MGDGNLPEIIPPSDHESVQIWHWHVPRKAWKAIKFVSVVSLLSFAAWLFQNFLQLRGVVNLLASRVDLAILGLCLLFALYVLTIEWQRKGTFRIAIGLAIVAAVFGIDWLAPKPNAPQADKSGRNTPSNVPSAAAAEGRQPQRPSSQLTTSPGGIHPARSQPPIQRTAKFAVLIPFNTAPNSEPIPQDENPDDPLFRTYQGMESLAGDGTIPEEIRKTKETGKITVTHSPVSMDASSDFLARLLQYYIFQSIDLLQRNVLTQAVGYPAEAAAGIEPPDAQPYSHDKLSQILADNRFFRPFLYRVNMQDHRWKLMPVMMPKGTAIAFKKDNQGYVVQFQRPSYFQVDFVIEAFVGTGVGNVPKHFVTSQIATTMQWTYIVTMRYSIEHPENAEFVPDSYAKWLDGLYDGLNKKLSLP